MDIMLILALIFFSTILYLRFDLALFFIIALLPSYLIRFSLFGIPFTFLEALIVLAFTFWLVKETKLKFRAWLKDKDKRQSYPYYKEIILILVSAFIATAVAQFSLPALGMLKAYFFEPIMLYILILNSYQKKEELNKITLALAISAIILSLFAIYQKLTGLFIANPFWQGAELRRVTSFYPYPNALSLFLGPIALLSLAQFHNFIKDKKALISIKLIYLFSFILSLLAIYFTKSKGALMALALTLVIYIFLTLKKQRVIIGVILALLAGLMLVTPITRSFLVEKATLSDLSGEIRKQQWRETMKTFTGPAILLGNGLGAYPQAVFPYHQDGIFFNRDKMENFHSILYGSAELRAIYWQPVEIYLYPHNIILNFWTELGLIGLIAFLWLIINYLRDVSKLCLKNDKNKLYLGLLTAMLAIIIHGLVDVPYFKNDLSALFFILLSLLALSKLQRRST